MSQTTVILAILALIVVLSNASIATALLKVGDSFLIEDAVGSSALKRTVAAGNQIMSFGRGRNRGKWPMIIIIMEKWDTRRQFSSFKCKINDNYRFFEGKNNKLINN
ncbi:TransThyretin-Related family domain [Caenorhabditis elegans]|uniref:TransThyretin-Related family domain n=1 Tax=Caenorhabditis elegans TaxID=6239 RepID=A0A3B1E628_CAEEL|nr:TransThyretin-Related family domain [Caenorhabditis elegans]VAY52148.1 TransThyretin-Related family domain [Caenorhabditis elegans]|eukprot:NP_001355424.1 Uncharacterized protein CELE_Y49F6B.19 [Caenorhabditis elegans]